MAIGRRAFVGGAVAAATCRLARAGAVERPNILWLTSEDNSPLLGCYGDRLAQTPHLDRLAAEGVRYTRAFANSPVCSAARSTLITGLHNISVGLQHHRSRVPLPEWVRTYPEYLREAGYYCTNNVKTDYNFTGSQQAPWDACSATAHYRDRRPGQPFFAIFNFTESHESQTFPEAIARKRQNGALPARSRLRPEEIPLPPYHPDVPEIRQEWADYYDCVTAMDRRVGEALRELEEAGLAEDTIVFYYSDHGGVLTRSKRFVYETGTRVPLIIRFPAKYRHLAPAAPSGVCDRLVSFIDLPPTLLGLAGAPVPEQFQGTPFLGPQAGPPADHVFLYRGRMDGWYDFTRAVRDERYRYIRNFHPHRPNGQPYVYADNAPTTPAWRREYLAGRCNAIQAAYWQPRPIEELYDTRTDPWEVRNLAGDPAHAGRLAALREKCRADMLAVRDSGFIPEGMFETLAGRGTIADWVRSDAYDLPRVMALAEAATSRDLQRLPELILALRAGDPLLRYWAAVGCAILAERARGAQPALVWLLRDPVASVRIAAAEAIARTGDPATGVAALAKELATDSQALATEALNALAWLGEAARPAAAAIRSAVANQRLGRADEPGRYILASLGLQP